MARGSNRTLLAATLAMAGAGLLWQPGCSSDEDDGGGGATATGTATGTSSGTPSGTNTGVGGGTSTGGAGGGQLCDVETVGECAPGEPWESDLNDPCTCCAATVCFDEATACCLEVGCMAIVDCVLTSGCEGAGCLGPCGQVIADNGGINGAPLAAAQALGDCVNIPCAGCDE